MSVRISSALVDAVLAHAATTPDREICGLLLGSPDQVLRVVQTANVSSSPADSFEIDPAALFTAHRAARDGGPDVVGHYHSHPNGSCEPSPRDAAAAVPGQLWLIVAGERAALHRAQPGGRFTRCTMINGSGAGCESTPHSSEGPPRKMVKVGT